MAERKGLTGVVISDKMNKSVVVRIMHLKKHPKYGKVIKIYKKYKAHDEKNTAKTGDTVQIIPTRPISKDKHFRVRAVLQKAHVRGELKEDVR